MCTRTRKHGGGGRRKRTIGDGVEYVMEKVGGRRDLKYSTLDGVQILTSKRREVTG